MEKVPFWEETYRNRDINTFPAEPNGMILEFEHLLKKDSAILEAGCGEGQNVRYLAKNGFSDIDAFDLSEAGISKLKWFCEREGLRIPYREAPAGYIVKWIRKRYDLTPEGMIDFLGLRNVDYNYTSSLGHFWRQWLPWEDESRPYGK